MAWYNHIYKIPLGGIKFKVTLGGTIMVDGKKKIIRKKAQVLQSDCVACGVCTKECPIGAARVVAGVFAEIDQARCVGCGKCEKACPASVIEMITKEEVK